jgi:hypothetical protein
MNKAKGDWRQLRALWPVAVAVLAACGGASDAAEDTAKTDETVTTTTNMESAEGRRRNSWVYCAAEGATCAVPSTRLVRYGANGRYFYKIVSGSIACNNSMWGDPAGGVGKRCDYAASTSAVAPAPAPAPAPQGVAVLTWTAPVSTAVAGYRVYFGTGPGSYFQAPGAGLGTGALTTYMAQGLQSGQTYHFAVTSVDSSGRESAYSNEVSKVVQ